MLHDALYGDSDGPAVILTYAWDRLLIDPLPGPRNPDDFTGLAPLTPAVRQVTAGSRPIPPAGSTLPRLADELPHRFALIDPRDGAAGVARQIEELVTRLRPTTVDLLDVGGDLLAQGDEPTLRSPLADSLTLAACGRVGFPIDLLIAGPGLDGELAHAELRDLLGPARHTFTAKDAVPIAPVLEWHPSEATGMLAATAMGVRGVCEIRDAGLPVPLTDESPAVHQVDLELALRRNRLARAAMATTSLDQVAALSREICGFSEIDSERDKAHRLTERCPTEFDAGAVLARLWGFEAGAHGRGITHTTFRHLTEALDLPRSQHGQLRALLVESWPTRYSSPLWEIACRR